MRSNVLHPLLVKSGFALAAVLLGGGTARAQSSLTLTAAPTSITLPDGQAVPMWGYACGATAGGASCTALDGSTQATGTWQPPLISVPAGQPLTITLVDQLTFATSGTPNAIPTSLIIDGQLGGGLGTDRTAAPSPAHPPQGTTWPGTRGTTNPGDPVFTPPAQADRVRSLATEVTVAAGATALTWTNPRPGTYLVHSGTQPSIQHAMGLYGVLVVTEPDSAGPPPARQAYGTRFDQDVPLLLSEIDPIQNRAVDAAVRTAGVSDTKVWSGQPGRCGDVPPSATATSEANTCYPPVVNYSPLYYLVNGVSFDRTASTSSARAVPAAAATGTVLLRLVNAGLRMHVPTISGASVALIAEDGNRLPGVARVQSEVFLPAGKTFDVAIQPRQSAPGTYAGATYMMFDRALGLSTANQRDGGMQVGIAVAGGAPFTPTTLRASDKSYTCYPGTTLAVVDPALGVLAGAVGANGAVLASTSGLPAGGTLDFHADGTFTYVPPAAGTCAGSFTYNVNGTQPHTATLRACDGAASCAGDAPVAGNGSFTSNVASMIKIAPPGVLQFVRNGGGYKLTATPGTTATTCGSVTLQPDGSFVATPATAPTTASATCSFSYNVSTASKRVSAADGTIVVTFLSPSNLAVNVRDAKSGVAIDDYRWIIEEDRTVWVDPKCQINTGTGARPLDSYGNPCPALPIEALGYNFHTSNMPVVAQGCVGAISCEAGQTVQGSPATCDLGNGACRAMSDASGLGVAVDPGAGQKTQLMPGDVHLDPHKHYFLSVMPGDGVNPTIGGAGGPVQVDPSCDASVSSCAMRQFDIAKDCGPYGGPTGAWEPGGAAALCGHAMGGAQIAPGQAAVGIAVEETPLPTAKIAVFVFEDDFPLNGEYDTGGGVDVLAPNEPGLAGFEVKLFDQAGGLGDATGQITYDMFNQPVSNSLAGTVDPLTKLDSCPITTRTDRLVGMIPTCPKYESDGKTLSPLAGQAVIANLYPGLYEIQAYPGADRIARGEEWLQTNTLDGTAPHEAFIRPNEPGYFQEFGPGGFHAAIGFANPAIVNGRKAGFCASTLNPGGRCDATLNVQVTNTHMSRTPDQRTYSSETYDHYSFTSCYVSVGPPDGPHFALQKCGPDGKVSFDHMPIGTFQLTVFDQWNDIILDGLVGTVQVDGAAATKEFPAFQWRANLYTRTFLDQNGDGVSQESEPGLALVNTNIRYRDGSIGFFNNTDLNGFAGFNEVFPFMNWLVVETSSTRFKPTSTHAVYDAGGPVDCSSQSGTCSDVAAHLANTDARVPLPNDLRVPGARYCDSADCPAGDAGGGHSTGTVFPPQPWGSTQGWQGLLGLDTFMEFGVKPYAPGENGGIQGHVIYASTRPFDDPSLLLQLSWEPGVPHVTVNLYGKTVDASGNEQLRLVDTTTTTSWDDWAQGFRKDASGNLLRGSDGNFIPNMNCPGQDPTSPFFLTLRDSKQWLDPNDPKLPLAHDSQFKCYDGWSMLTQIQPAPYDGMYGFPSVTGVDPATGRSAGTNCHAWTDAEPWGCKLDPDTSDAHRSGTPMLAPGTYVVEVVVPPGYELVKEEDKNILLGDVYVAPVTQQFAGFGDIFILPDQATVNAYYNKNSPGGLDNTTNQGSVPRHEGDTGSVEAFWPCVGAERIVPDLNSLFPGAGQAAPFAGARRRLCDRKEVVLTDEASVLAKFYVFSSTHVAAHFTGLVTNDFSSEFDPFSPQFGEKFAPPNLPIAFRDFAGNEVARVYSDQWGSYDGLYYSTYGVNPPNPTGYVPQMPIVCMNDPGPIPDGQGGVRTDPDYNQAYSNFCYEWSMMPGTTAYMDTPVLPTQGFADGYNLPDAEYPDGTPAIKQVVSTAANGPWVRPATAAAAATVTITFTNVSVGDSVTSVVAGATTLTGGSLVCNPANACFLGMSPMARNNRMAALVTGSIAARSAATGVTASQSGNTVTLQAVATGAALNGTTVTVNRAGIGVGGTLVFAGGASASPAAMDLTITALGDKTVVNPNYSGPNSAVAPFNTKTITRHYGFGDARGTVTIGGVPLAVTSWSDTTISGTVNPTGVPSCAVQQRGQGGARCGELVVTAANGKQSIDAVTVTIGGSTPWIVTPNDPVSNTGGAVTAPPGRTVKNYGASFGRMWFSPLQVAIDSAAPGDLILVQPGTYRENVLMWKPVRLQGVGAAAVVIDADAHPAGKLDAWRRQMNCVFGLDLDGAPDLGNVAFTGADPNNGLYSCPNEMFQRVDRIAFQSVVGWDTAGNGNLAEVLQEPTMMGSYEGAGVTVLGRGVRIPAGSNDFWGVGAVEAAFPNGSLWLTGSPGDCAVPASNLTSGRDYGTSNYYCNPSRIDGISITNSSQGGGGVFVNGWAHNLEVANTRIFGNQGTLAGAINVGNGEIPDAFVNDGVECGVTPVVTPCPPINDSFGTISTNEAIPFQFNTRVRIHHNMLYDNSSIGDSLFSGTPTGAGAITVSAGADGYQIDHNWIAGNLSVGDGGGLQHVGLSFLGNISNNYILFNQTTNPTLPTNGGGLVVEGGNLDRILNGTECGSTNDQDCPPGLSEGTGPGLVIDANLFLGNSAESGSGGGLRIQQVNASELVAFPRNSNRWYDVTVTNNVIANNVAGYDGGGVSLQDALKVTFTNNTVVDNDSTASAGVLFKTLGAINAATPPPGCTPQTDPTLPQDPSCTGVDAPHGPQPAGLVTMAHTPNLIAQMPDTIVCPPGFGYGSGSTPPNPLVNGDCRRFSRPDMSNDLFWQNRSFHVDLAGPGGGNQSQQNLVVIAPLLNQTATGQCATGPDRPSYWDVGLRTDDVTAGTIPAGTSLTLTTSIVTNTTEVGGSLIVPTVTPVIAQFCNGARVPPENCAGVAGQVSPASCLGYNAPPGTSETTGLLQAFTFNDIKPTATVDEGHNWINLSYGPLTLNRSAVQPGSTNPPELMVASKNLGPGSDATLVGLTGGAYSVPGTSAAVNRGTNEGTPATDFFGNRRPRNPRNPADIGAVEFQAPQGSTLVVASPAPLGFTDVVAGTIATRDLVLTNNGTTPFAIPAVGISPAAFSRVAFGPSPDSAPSCGGMLPPGASCTIRVRWAAPGGAPTTATGSITVDGVANSPVAINANTVAPAPTLAASPSSLELGSWATGTTSAAQNVTVTNTGNVDLAGLAFAFGGGTPQPFSRVTGGSFPADAPSCGTALAVGASCTVKLQFAPTAAIQYARSFAVTATGVVTPAAVSLAGTGVAARATVSITPNPLTITLAAGAATGTGTVRLTNTAPITGGARMTVSSVAVAGGSLGQRWAFTPVVGADGCTGATLAPGQSCTVGVRFTNFGARGTNRTGSVTFTDNAQPPTSGSGTQSAVLSGVSPAAVALRGR